MPENHQINEPPIDPLADTNPSLTIRQVQLQQSSVIAPWRRVVGLVSLLVAAALTAATALILLTPALAPANSQPAATTQVEPTDQPTAAIIIPTIDPSIVSQAALLPTLNAEAAAVLLNQPLAPVNDELSSIAISRDNYDPFTFVKQERPRGEVISYTAVQGDTIYTIAERFKIKPESIAWSNPRRIVLVLRPGDEINIPPVDGVYFQVVSSQTIQDYASQYKLTDPYLIIDSEYNTLPAGTTPDVIPPNGSYLFVPGGEGEEISWNPGVTTDESSGERRGFITAFAPGDPGSCGNVDNPGGGAAWGNPLPGGTFVRGFSSFHTGIDLSASVGTTVFAANSGAVVFAGWNSWGYGNTIVLAHGPFLTLYGHLSSINVRCRDYVVVGQPIGAVGNTGNSSGPHLHFEIRNGNAPTDPGATIGGLGF